MSSCNEAILFSLKVFVCSFSIDTGATQLLLPVEGESERSLGFAVLPKLHDEAPNPLDATVSAANLLKACVIHDDMKARGLWSRNPWLLPDDELGYFTLDLGSVAEVTMVRLRNVVRAPFSCGSGF